MSEDTIATALGIPAQTISNSKSLVAVVANPANTDLQNDYAFARQNLYDVLTKGGAALEELLEIAKQSQHPRAYEVLSKLVKDMGDTNARLLELHKDMTDLQSDQEGTSEQAPIQVSNAIFVGTTTELLEIRNQAKRLK
jgi:hypothetical protein